MFESECTATDGSAEHSLAALEMSESVAAMMQERWINTVEEAVSCLAFEEKSAERDEFLLRARELLGERRYTELSTLAEARPLGCLVGEARPETQEDGER